MSHSQKIYLYISVLIIVSIIFIVFLIQPIIKGIISKSVEFKQAKIKLNSIELLVENFSYFEESYNYYEQFLEGMEDILTGESAIDPEIPINFISFFKQEAKELTLTLKVIPIETKEIDDFWIFLDFRIEGTGEYSNFNQFLKKLEFGHWFAEVKRLNIRKEKISNKYNKEQDDLVSKDMVQFDLLIRIYAQEKN